MLKIQTDLNNVYRAIFGYTPLTERIKDIQNQFFEFVKWKDVNHLRKKTGDMLSSLIQLCNENGWDIEELIAENINTVEGLQHQYKTLGRKTKVCILGGAFNPVTIGHIQTAKYILDYSRQFDEVWLMPTYKHMYNKSMVDCEMRLEMCRIAASVDSRIKVFDFEIKNQLRGETFFTCKKLLSENTEFANYKFSMAIGIDNANTFDHWVNYEELEKIMPFVIIPRKGFTRDESVDWYLKPPHIFLQGETNIIEMSSTTVRELLKRYYTDGDENVINSLKTAIDSKVLDYILHNKLY